MICKLCGKEFEPSKNDPRIVYCSEKCRIENRRVNNYMKKYYSENSNKWSERQKQEQYKADKNKARREKYSKDAEYREKAKATAREYNAKNPRVKAANRLKTEYGLTIEQYDKMLESQNGKCAICGGDQKSSLTKNLYVDHDHETGAVRALLCNNCNFILGHAKDDTDILKRAIEYLEYHNNN